MKKNFLFLLILFAVVCKMTAQTISKEILEKYPASIVLQVYDLTNKAKIDEDVQNQVAELLLQKEQTLFKMLQGDQKDNEIKDSKESFDKKITSLLNLEQKYDNYVATKKEDAKDKYSYSQFAIAIRYRDSLKVSDNQYQELLTQVGKLKELKNQYYEKYKSGMDSRAYESENIARILTESQYGRLLVIKNYSKVNTYAEADWLEIEQRKIATEFKKEDAIAELKKYYNARECTYNKYQHDLVKQKVFIREVYANRPAVLRILEKIRRNPDNDTTTKIYKW
jgi:hypothetical protein